MSKVRARHANCSVVGCKNQHKCLYSVPAPEDQRKQWLLFIFNNNVPSTVSAHLFVCANHFTSECFNNWGQYKAGYASTLTLIKGSSPTVRGPATTCMPSSAPLCTLLPPQTESRQPISAAAQQHHGIPDQSDHCMDNEKIIFMTPAEPPGIDIKTEDSDMAISSEEPTATYVKTESSDMPLITNVKTVSSDMTSSQQFSATHVTTQQGNITLLICPKRTVSIGTQCVFPVAVQSAGTQLSHGTLTHARGKATVATQFSQLMLSIGTQCFYTASTKSASTQLSHGTLTHVRSKGTQVSLCCSVCKETPKKDRGLVPSPPPAPLLDVSPPKRARVEIEAEEDDEGNTTHIPEPSKIRDMESTCHYNEPKYIVYESCLRALFQTCPLCKQDCEVQQQRLGTYVSFSQLCPKCLYRRKWQNQPIRGSTPVGNLQMSAAVYFTGGSFAQVKKVCKAMNLQMFQKDTFKRHVRMFLEPAIIHKWKEDQQTLIQDLQLKSKITVGGFMRADSPGKSAKFSSCSLMNLEKKHIIDVQLAQSTEVGQSSNIETEALRRGLDLLDSNHLNVDYIVTDCIDQVQEYLKERKVTQYYDVCHFEKGLSENLGNLAKKRKFKEVRLWLPFIKKHIYWTARSSKSGSEKVAKWKSLVNCLQNIHKHDDPLFPECAHPHKVATDTNKWLQPGSNTLHRVEKILMRERVLRNVENLSHEHQTSSLEDFHSDVLRFAPKKEDFPFIERLCRLYLAAMHFNENVEREEAATAEEQAVNRKMFLKSKRRKPEPKRHKREPTCNYVRDLMTLLFDEVLKDPSTYTEELKQIPIPEDLHALLGRPS